MGKIFGERELERMIDERDESIDAAYDLFIGEFPEEQMLKRILESELIHPHGIGNLLDVEETSNTFVREWSDENIVEKAEVEGEAAKNWLEENRQQLLEKVHNNFYDQVSEKAESKYKEIIIEEISEKDDVVSIGDEINKINEQELYKEISLSEVRKMINDRV